MQVHECHRGPRTIRGSLFFSAIMWGQGLNSGQQSELRSTISAEVSYFFIYYFLHEYLLDFITVGHFNIGSRELRKSFHLFFFSCAKHNELAETTSFSDDQYVNERSNFKTWQNALVDKPTPMHIQAALSELSGLKKKKEHVKLRAEVVEGMGEELKGRVWEGRLDGNITYAYIQFSNSKDKPQIY